MRKQRSDDYELFVCDACGKDVRLLTERNGLQRFVDSEKSSFCPSEQAIFHMVSVEQLPLLSRKRKRSAFWRIPGGIGGRTPHTP
jgi:hypothetical protein